LQKKSFKEFNNKSNLKVLLDFLGNLFFTYCCIIAIALILFSSVTIECEVVGDSMRPNFNNYSGNSHDIVFINIYNRDISYKDVVVCKTDNESIIKRVIGLPGDKIDIVYADNEYKLELNGKINDEDYILVDNDPRLQIVERNGMEHTYKKFQSYKESYPEYFNEEGKYVVPNNSIFVLGDNRFVSVDSTVYGAFDLDRVEGKVELVKYAETSLFEFYYDYIIEGKFLQTIINIF